VAVILKRLSNLGLPLLLKELLEQSARRRTYWIRVAYVSLLLFTSLAFLTEVLSTAPGTSRNLGTLGAGMRIYIDLMTWQFAGIYLFLPALMSGAFTVEKEQNTLGLLFLTKLGQWTIVLEKFLSRLIPMSCFLLTSLPLMAFSYSFGGLEIDSILGGIWLLTVTMFKVAAITLACSAFCRTTASALLSTYATLAVLTYSIPVLDYVVLNGILNQLFANLIILSAGNSGSMPETTAFIYLFEGFIQFIVIVQQQQTPFGVWTAPLLGLPSLLVGCIALLMARAWVVRRAFIPPSNLILRFLRWVDGKFQIANRKWGRGILIFNESISMPDTAPIAWRETQKRALGQFRYLLRVFLAITIPTVLCVVYLIIRESLDPDIHKSAIIFVVPVLWLVTTLLISVVSAGLISGERGHQTLDVLLTTPLIGRQIILEKLAGINRLILVCSIPIAACIFFSGYWHDAVGVNHVQPREPYEYWEYLVSAFSMLLIYPRLNAWVSLWVGVKCRTATRAILTMLVVLVAICILPIFLSVIALEVFHLHGKGPAFGTGYMMLLQFSPLAMIMVSEFGTAREFSTIPFLPVTLNCLWYGMWLYLIRRFVLKSADQLLGRAPSSP
jgi:ABC-type transport system involved in multi-copper enzyme maturation permease subunit